MEYRSEHLVGTFEEFFWRKNLQKKNSQKYWSVLQIGIPFFQSAKTPHFQKQPSLNLTWLDSLIFSLQP